MLRAQSWRNIPVDAFVLLLFLLCVPALLLVDLAVFVLVIVAAHDLWPFHALRAGYPWLRDKERRMWGRRRRELRREFLAEDARLLPAGRSQLSS